MIDTSIPVLHKTLENVMLILMQGSIFLEGLVPLLPSVYALIKLLLHARFHMFYVAWTKVVIIDEIVNHPSVTMFLG